MLLAEGGFSGSQSRVSRLAPSGTDIASSGSSSCPRAISKEPPPMSRFRMGPAPQPYQRRTAKKVMDASSLPVSSRRVTVVSCLTRARTAAPLVASRIAEVQKARRSSALCRAANSQASSTNSVSSCWPSSLMLPSGSRYWTRDSGRLWDANGTGCAPAWASTRSRWTVLDPMSRTPRRMGTLLLVGALEVAPDVRHAFRIDLEPVGGAGVDHHAQFVADIGDDGRALGAQHVGCSFQVLLVHPGGVRKDGEDRAAVCVGKNQRLNLGVHAFHCV